MTRRNDGRLGTIQAVKKIGVSPERLRYWEAAGIVNPTYIQCGTRRYRRFSKEDIDRAFLVKKLVDHERYSLEGAIRKLKEK